MRQFLPIALVFATAACSDAPPEPGTLRRAGTAGAATVRVEGRVSGTGTVGLRVRKEPTTASEQVGKLDEGAVVTIACRAEGEVIDGNKFWDRIEEAGGGYVADAFIDMGDAESALPRCDGPAEPPTGALPPGGAGPVDIEGPPVRPHVQAFADEACRTVGACRASTYRGHQPSADLALDFPTGEDYGKLPTDDHAFGDRLAAFAIENRAKYRVEYVIYRQRIHLGEGWRPMEDRGSITQNHFDHVHVSFEP